MADFGRSLCRQQEDPDKCYHDRSGARPAPLLPVDSVSSGTHTNVFRFKRKTSTEGFSPNWKQAWREDCDVTTEQWLTRMKEDGCMADLVHAVEVPVPFNREAYLAEMSRLSQQMARPAAELPTYAAGRLFWGLVRVYFVMTRATLCGIRLILNCTASNFGKSPLS